MIVRTCSPTYKPASVTQAAPQSALASLAPVASLPADAVLVRGDILGVTAWIKADTVASNVGTLSIYGYRGNRPRPLAPTLWYPTLVNTCTFTFATTAPAADLSSGVATSYYPQTCGKGSAANTGAYGLGARNQRIGYTTPPGSGGLDSIRFGSDGGASMIHFAGIETWDYLLFRQTGLATSVVPTDYWGIEYFFQTSKRNTRHE